MHTPAEPGAAFPLGLVRPRDRGAACPNVEEAQSPGRGQRGRFVGVQPAPWDVQEAGHGAPHAFRSPVGSPPSTQAPSAPIHAVRPRVPVSHLGRVPGAGGDRSCRDRSAASAPRSLPRLGLGRPRLQAVTCLAVITGDFRGFAFLPGPRLGNNFHHQAVPEKELSTCMAQPRLYPGSSAGTGDVGALVAPSWVHPGHCEQPPALSCCPRIPHRCWGRLVSALPLHRVQSSSVP